LRLGMTNRQLRTEAGFSVWLEENGRYILGEKEAEILKGIKKFGSLMVASKSLGITYAHAWNVLNDLSGRIGDPVVRARRGGEGGGGMMLTDTGERLLGDYENLERRVSELLGKPKELTFTEFKRPELSIIGSSCVGIKIIAGLMDTNVEYIEVGSSAGLAALMLGEADISGIHLYDEETGSYNLPFIKRGRPEGTAVLIKGYMREQGFMVKHGNPSVFSAIEDLRNMRLVNRNLGSGTRILLDKMLRDRGVKPECVRGYDFEVRKDEEVAKAILEGKADVGLGLRATAAIFGLDFIKAGDECFDFAVERRRLGKEAVKKFIQTLRSAEFEREITKNAPGIYLQRDTGEIIS